MSEETSTAIGELTEDAAPAPVAITHRKVTSSNLVEVGFDEASGILEVLFKSGGRYRYAGVSADTYGALMTSSSPGGYLASHIKPKHACTRQPEEKA